MKIFGVTIQREPPPRCEETEGGGWRCERRADRKHDHWISPRSIDAGFDTSGPWAPEPDDYDADDDPWRY